MKRVMKWLLGAVAAVILLCAGAIFLLMQAFSSGVSEDEVARVRAPNGRLDAVLLERNAGATTSFGYKVYVVPAGATARGTEAAFLYGAVRNSNAYGANLHWLSGDHLGIEYLQTKTGELKQPKVTTRDGSFVFVSLQPGVTDPSAPAGGMLYNLRGK